ARRAAIRCLERRRHSHGGGHRRPVRRRRRHQGPDRALRRRPAADPAAVPAAQGRRAGGRRGQGVDAVTALTAPVRVAAGVNRRYLAAGTFVALGLADIVLFGSFAHSGDAVFALSLPGATPHVASIRVPAATACYALGAISIGLGVLRATTEVSRRMKRLTIAGALLCFLLSLLCWAAAGNSLPLNVVD